MRPTAGSSPPPGGGQPEELLMRAEDVDHRIRDAGGVAEAHGEFVEPVIGGREAEGMQQLGPALVILLDGGHGHACAPRLEGAWVRNRRVLIRSLIRRISTSCADAWLRASQISTGTDAGSRRASLTSSAL